MIRSDQGTARQIPMRTKGELPHLRVVESQPELLTQTREGDEVCSVEEVAKWLEGLRAKIRESGPLLCAVKPTGTKNDAPIDCVITDVAPRGGKGSDSCLGVLECSLYEQGKGVAQAPDNGAYRSEQNGWIANSTHYMWNRDVNDGALCVVREGDAGFTLTFNFRAPTSNEFKTEGRTFSTRYTFK